MNVETVSAVYTDDVAIVVLKVTNENTFQLFTGDSKRDPIDKSNPQIGLAVAYARAFGKLAKQLDRQAKGLVKHADDMRDYKKEQKANSKKRHPSYRGFMVGDTIRIKDGQWWQNDDNKKNLAGATGQLINSLLSNYWEIRLAAETKYPVSEIYLKPSDFELV